MALSSCSRGDGISTPPPIDANPIAAYRPLIGTWSGARQIGSVGTATGVVSIDASGLGNYFVTVAGAQHSGQLQILGLTKRHVRATALGHTRSIPIAIGANQLRLQVAGIGEVVLNRAGRLPANAPSE